MKIALASDHAGYEYKTRLIDVLNRQGYTVVDFGTDSAKRVDYPDYIYPAAQAVASGQCDRGIVLGGSGNGEAIVANRLVGVRCALCYDRETARLATEHNKANMISIGERLTEWEDVLEIVQTWLTCRFQAGRHLRRIKKIDSMVKEFSSAKLSTNS